MRTGKTIEAFRVIFAAGLLIVWGLTACTAGQEEKQQKTIAAPAPAPALPEESETKEQPVVFLRGTGWNKDVVVARGSDEIIMAHNASAMALSGDGDAVYYDDADGAGGFENEGQSVYRYDLLTGQKTKLLAEYYAVDSIAEVGCGAGCKAVLVFMEDGGLGAAHFAVIDPGRGEVFRAQMCRPGKLSNDSLQLNYFTEWAWGVLNSGRPASIARVRPFRTEWISLSRVLRQPVINNPYSGM